MQKLSTSTVIHEPPRFPGFAGTRPPYIAVLCF